jgi:opacity protein-like surface antigen
MGASRNLDRSECDVYWRIAMRLIRLVSLAAMALLISASIARAEGHANLFVGSNFSGDAGRSLSTALNDGSRLTWGGALGGTVRGIFGAEVDFAYARHFFGSDNSLGNNYVLTLMPSLVVGVPVGGEKGPGFRPYGTAGFGLIRRDLTVSGIDAIKDNDLGYSVGFGVDGYATDHFGVRADYRYFRNVNADDSSNVVGISLDRGNFSFSRGTLGAVFRF